MAIISLITDFGLEDEYVGLMKAVILGIDPLARLVDISHAVEPQDVVHAAFLLESAGRYFPPGSIHVAVVDPGVGTTRALLCLEANGHRFLAPDNGVLSLVMDAFRPASLRRLENATLWRSRVSATFHGRDILAPAAAHLSRGVLVRDLGPELDPADVVRLAELRAKRSPDGNIAGRIVHIDRFGNLVTNIDTIILQSSGGLAHERPATIRLAGQAIIGIRRTYADAEPGRPVALIGSRGYLEIAVCCGSARSYFNVRRGDAVAVRPSG
jgi:S-adenosylmethionine hydrolase